MSRNIADFCSFCLKTHNEVSLIDTTRNSLLIDDKCFEFSYIFNDLFPFTSFEEGCLCEVCKDLLVQFFLFKRNVKVPQNPFKKMISAQIDDFLSQNESNVEQIKVIRTYNSITLQLDKEEVDYAVEKEERKPTIADLGEKDSYDDNENLTYESATALIAADCCFNCDSCGITESSESDLELHQFLKHSSFGIQLEVELENSKAFIDDDMQEAAFWICSFCSGQLDSSSSLLAHLLCNHSPELLFQINDLLSVESHLINFQAIESYISCIRECLQYKDYQHMIDNEECRKIFFETYGEFENVSTISDEKDIVEEEMIAEQDIELMDEIEEEMPILRREKTDRPQQNDLSMNDKEWLKLEISRSKCIIKSDTGEQRVIFRCQLVESCNHISNSASGIRYHLMKHMRNRDNLSEQRKIEISLDGYQFVTKSGSKNCCTECNLKFKDSRALQLHQKCHDLFETIAQHSNLHLPSCNTCNQKFINEIQYRKHMHKHDVNENVLQPIIIAPGAIRQQGKAIGNTYLSLGETNEVDYNWSCGHCESKYFSKEEHLNLHILLMHTTNFICPIDKMEFSGFKSVSLFIHHLRNKHSELFPNLSFACTFCQTEFSTIYDKLTHMKSCDMKQFQCDHCEKRFFKKGDLVAHLKVSVTGEVQFACSICGKKCLSGSDLNIHLRSHSKIKPYKCGQCSKAFRTLAARASHVEGHNPQPVFECEVCSKTFRQRQLYRRHMKSAHERKAT